MGERYEWAAAKDAGVDCAGPGEVLGENECDDWALVLGEPDATALVVEGSRPQLMRFLAQALDVIDDSYRAEHANALHNDEPEEDCPECAQGDDFESSV